MKKRRVKKNKIKRNKVLSNNFYVTLDIVTKILPIIYIIPLYSIIGLEGGILYSYIYTLYILFLAITSTGISFATEKLTNEYINDKLKEKIFNNSIILSILFGVILFLILIILAPVISKGIIGTLDSDKLRSLTFLIRVIFISVILLPILSVYKSYINSHKLNNNYLISILIEQLTSFIVIVIGSLISIKVLKLNITGTICIISLGIISGLLFSLIYLITIKVRKKKLFASKQITKITNKKIRNKIIIYATPIIILELFKSLYNVIDLFTVLKVYINIYGVKIAEEITSIILLWGNKINIIIISISLAITTSLVPKLATSLITKNKNDINKKINMSLQMLFFITIPLSIIMSFLSKPLYTLFFGISKIGPSIVSIYIFVGLFTSLFIMALTITKTLKEYKILFISLASGVLLKLLINIFLIKQFNSISLPAYYGSIFATIFGMLLSSVICLIYIKIKYKLNYEETFKQLINILCGSIIITIALFILKIFIPIYSNIRIINLFIIIIYFIIAFIIYSIYMYLTNSLDSMFGKNVLKIIKKR